MMRLHFTQKSSMTSPRRASRISVSVRPICRSIPDFRFCRSAGRLAWRLNWRQYPLGRLEPDVLENAKVAGVGFEQVAHVQRMLGGAHFLPERVFVGPFDLAGFLIILAL